MTTTPAEALYNEETRQIAFELRFISLSCSVASLLLGLTTLVHLVQAISAAKSKSQKLRVPIYRVSALYISFIILYVLAILFVSIFPWLSPYCDVLIDICTLAAVVFWFQKWDEALNLLVNKNFICFLSAEDPQSQKSIFSRINNLASK